ncbi:MAG: bifunctional DNA-formamidopyrimidine glycosylase/DNA-(apurinic or apyrimidinic site) lyase [Anaerolineae bacterium]
MPELPEVETIARHLRPVLVDRSVVSVEVLWPRSIAKPTPDRFGRELTGARFDGVGRRGKYLILALADGRALLVHLRMTGRLLFYPEGGQLTSHTRVVIGLDGGASLHFVDQRKFGRLWLTHEPDSVLGRLGPEPLDPDFTPDELARRLLSRRTPIKAVLLDQRCVAGIGNIYADESLFLAGIDPRRPAWTLSHEEVAALHGAIRRVLSQAIGLRGSTLRDYRLPTDEQGDFQTKFHVFRRVGEPCPRCGRPIERVRIAQRSTHYCPSCQC